MQKQRKTKRKSFDKIPALPKAESRYLIGGSGTVRKETLIVNGKKITCNKIRSDTISTGEDITQFIKTSLGKIKSGEPNNQTNNI